MKVFFTGSPRALKNYRSEHEAIYKAIEQFGALNLSDLVVKADPDAFYSLDHEQIVKHYNETMEMVKKADVVVMEVSLHSLSMGFIVDRALAMGRSVIALYLPGHTPFFFSGINDDKLQVVQYTVDGINRSIAKWLMVAQGQVDVRFNFFVSSGIMAYLDTVSREKRIPRSVFLRELIEADMRKRKTK